MPDISRTQKIELFLFLLKIRLFSSPAQSIRLNLVCSLLNKSLNKFVNKKFFYNLYISTSHSISNKSVKVFSVIDKI